jgi:signal transduction histidine kinase
VAAAGSEPRTLTGGWELVFARSVAAVTVLCLLAALVLGTAQTHPVAAHPRNWIVAVVCCLLGLRVVGHVRRNAVGWLLLAMGAGAAVAIGTMVWPTAAWPTWVGIWAWWPSYALLPVLILLFPTGRPLSRWWTPVVALAAAGAIVSTIGLGWASWQAPLTFWVRAVDGRLVRSLPILLCQLGALAVVACLVLAVVSLIVRWWRAAGDERRLLSWTLVCVGLLVIAIYLESSMNVPWTWALAATALPTAAVIAITRFGLYDIDLLIHRSVLYAAMALLLVGLYAVLVLSALRAFPDQSIGLYAVGAALMAIAAAPLRQVLQRGLDRWLYGDRARPYDVLSRLGQSLEHSLAQAEVFATVAACVADALRLPYVAVCAGTGSGARRVAEHGRSRGWPQLRFPMNHRGEPVGELVAEVRAPDERLGRREQRLLADLARQTAPAARSLQLTEDLQQARERLVRAREEERLRIRRDLHDGVGPSLAGVRMQVDAARQMLDGEPPRVGEMLDRAVHNINATSVEVRNLIDGLRPPVLDMGLLAALREEAARFSRPDLTVDVTADDHLGPLPAAVEVAAYRVAAEALTNAARHSGAAHCHVRLRWHADLELEILDDGHGIPVQPSGGVGLGSMRERCAELGGKCTITPARPNGTRVYARIPLGPGDDGGREALHDRAAAADRDR